MKSKNFIEKPFYVKNFLSVLFIYFLLQLLLRVNISPSLELDESEQILLSQSFEWGYNSQPPLYTWLQMLFFELFGRDVFALSLLKNSLLFLTYFFVYKSTKLISHNHTIALIATASLILIPQISWESQRDLTHSVLLTTVSSIIFYIVMRIKYSSSQVGINYYMLLGIFIALGILSKYSFVIFIFSMLVTSLFDRRLRQFILSKKIIITIMILFLCLFPHLMWLFTHLELAINSTMDKLNIGETSFSYFDGIKSLVKAIVFFLLPYIIVVMIFFRRAIIIRRDVFLLYFFIIISLVLIFFIIFTGTTQIKDRWMQPYFFLMVIYIATMIDIDKLKILNIPGYFKMVYIVMFIILVVMFIRIYFPDTIKKYYRLNYPFNPIAKQIKNKGFKYGLILAENKLIGGNLKLNFPDSVVWCNNYRIRTKKNFEKTLIIWDKNFPTIAKKYKSSIIQAQTISTKYLHSSQKNYKLNFIIINSSF